ncbi:MAG: Chemoreceptor glutamine deamidase CheD [Firmicutes bacterium]|nr:Chemoreceptor glutamine deamidase CheD [Bacillota bacterium]MBT9153261.1 Chemoreceptor glutamine deamidase CheD [Bacillota bacterium]
MDYYVGIGELCVARAPSTIVTRGLGSCVGVVLHDINRSVGGLAHIMLPSSTDFTSYTNPHKFADLAIPAMHEQLQQLGGRNFKARIAGGAKMFATISERAGFDVGFRNVERVRQVLRQLGIAIVNEDVGGSVGRTVTFEVSTGSVKVRSVGRGEQLL